MRLKGDTKFGEESTCRFKIGIRNLTKFDLSSRKSQKFHFNDLLLSKVYIAWAKNVQRNYLSWNWKGIQNLERNRLVVSELAEGIWQNLTGELKSLKHFHLNELLLRKLYVNWDKKVERYNLPWNWRGIQIL